MSYSEALDWAAYIRSNGPLDLGARMEHGFAMVAHQIHLLRGGKAKITDFMPHVKEQPISLEEAMNSWV